jgi:predicted lipase
MLDNLDMQLIALDVECEHPRTSTNQLPPILDTHSVPAVQRGFLRRHTSLAKRLDKAIETMKSRHVVSSIRCTGHSLGGVDAVLCALLLIAPRHRIPVSVHTFGSPRIGNTSFAAWADTVIEENIRVVHVMDLVCRLPLFRASVGTCVLLTYIGTFEGFTVFDKIALGPLLFHTCEQYIIGSVKAADTPLL